MGIFRRSADRTAPDDRTRGLELGVGLASPPVARRGRAKSDVLRCGTCGTRGRIDMIDTTIRRAYLTCEGCGRIWDTDRASVPAQPFFSRR